MIEIFKRRNKLFQEVLFENRNKEYGAYQLRKLYPKHLERGLIISVSLFLVFIFTLYALELSKEQKEIYDVVDYRTEEFSLEEKVLIPEVAQKLPPPPKKEAVKEDLPPKPAEEEKKTDKKEDPKTEKTEEKGKETGKEDGTGKSETTITGNDQVKSVSNDTTGTNLYSNEIFMKVEIPAEFPGGQLEFSKFIYQNIKFPPYAIENKVDGIVYVHMIVNNDGSISELKIYKGIEQSCNDEVLRLMKLMPKWVPARQKGMYVRQRIIVPIRFKAF